MAYFVQPHIIIRYKEAKMKKSTSIVIGIGFLLIVFYSCKESTVTSKTLDYCKMLEDDQTLKGQDRKNVFKENFKSIIEYTQRNGFPNYDFNELPKDSCKTWAVMATLIHITQTSPELIFNNDILELFSVEIEKGNLNPEDIYPAFKVSTGGGQMFCDSLEPIINKTFDKWKMDPELREYFVFRNCENDE